MIIETEQYFEGLSELRRQRTIGERLVAQGGQDRGLDHRTKWIALQLLATKFA